MIQNLNNVGGVASTGTDNSVTMAQEGLQRSMNQASVQQMKMMEKQANMQLSQTMINNSAEMMNSAKQTTEKVRL